MQLRVKHKRGQSVISTLSLSSKVEQLLSELSTLTQIPVHLVRILRGFPPVPLDTSDRNSSLEACGFQVRDSILVEELPETKAVQPPPKPQLPIKPMQSEASLSDAPKGILLRQVVPSDNSCLFTSISYCLSGMSGKNCCFQRYLNNCYYKGKQDRTAGSFMRELVASTVVSQPEQYNEALLGKPIKEYSNWILKVLLNQLSHVHYSPLYATLP